MIISGRSEILEFRTIPVFSRKIPHPQLNPGNPPLPLFSFSIPREFLPFSIFFPISYFLSFLSFNFHHTLFLFSKILNSFFLFHQLPPTPIKCISLSPSSHGRPSGQERDTHLTPLFAQNPLTSI